MEHSINKARLITQYEESARQIEDRLKKLREEQRQYHWYSNEYSSINRRIERLESDLENLHTGLCLLRRR